MYKTVDSICAFVVVILLICSAFVIGIKLGTKSVERKDQEIEILEERIENLEEMIEVE